MIWPLPSSFFSTSVFPSHILVPRHATMHFLAVAVNQEMIPSPTSPWSGGVRIWKCEGAFLAVMLIVCWGSGQVLPTFWGPGCQTPSNTWESLIWVHLSPQITNSTPFKKQESLSSHSICSPRNALILSWLLPLFNFTEFFRTQQRHHSLKKKISRGSPGGTAV